MSFAELSVTGMSGGKAIDLYACVDRHAFNAANELFNLTAAGEWLSLAQPDRCIVHAEACAGAGSTLCLAPCGTAPAKSALWRSSPAPHGGTIYLSPATDPSLCVTAAAPSTLALQPSCSPLFGVHLWSPRPRPRLSQSGSTAKLAALSLTAMGFSAPADQAGYTGGLPGAAALADSRLAFQAQIRSFA